MDGRLKQMEENQKKEGPIFIQPGNFSFNFKINYYLKFKILCLKLYNQVNYINISNFINNFLKIKTLIIQ